MKVTPERAKRLLRGVTAGEWRATLQAGASSGCREIRGAKSGKHRQAQRTMIAFTAGLSNDRQDAANGRLIAAAPALATTVVSMGEELARLRAALSEAADDLSDVARRTMDRADMAAADRIRKALHESS